MNRAQRRAAAAKARRDQVRHAAVRTAIGYMTACNDPSITGATVITPDGKVLHVGADAARTAPKPGNVQ